MNHPLVKTSKFLSLVLRHDPGVIGLTLDSEGWVDIDLLIDAARTKGHALTRELIADIVASSDKQRFAISADGNRIRANQGHSIAVDLALPVSRPPGMLYHGTATRFIASIKEQGLLPGSRQHVHMSRDEATAIKVGQRHGKPIVLQVKAAALFDTGTPFFISENGVWLTAHVPVAFLVFPP